MNKKTKKKTTHRRIESVMRPIEIPPSAPSNVNAVARTARPDKLFSSI